MRKLQILGAAFFAVLALSAMVASSAFAEDLWLANGAAIGAASAATTAGKLLIRLLPVIGGNVHIICDGKFLGTVGPGSADEITKVEGLTLPAEELWINCEVLHSELGLCSGALLVLVMAINLPWKTKLLLLANGGIADMFEGPAAKEPGYESECTGAFGEKIKEACEGNIETDDLENMINGPVLGQFLNQLSKKCGINGNVAHVDSVGAASTTLNSGATISVSHN